MRYKVCKVLGIQDGKLVYGPGTEYNDRNKANVELWKIKQRDPKNRYAIIQVK